MSNMTVGPIQSKFLNSRAVPQALLLCAAFFMIILLAIPLTLPVGPNFWDLSLYLDAAHRISNGQIPSVDFLTPTGPAEYYLFYALNRFFPAAHPLLTSQWAIAILALPFASLMISGIPERSRSLLLALVFPLLLLMLLPLNSNIAYPSPGFDGYGIYNRHAAILLYILVASLLFVEDRIKLQVLIASLMAGLLLVKVTGFVSGALIVSYALLTRKIGFLDTAISAICVLAILIAIELITGIISGYLTSILELATLNQGSFSRRLLGFIGSHFDVYLSLITASFIFIYAQFFYPKLSSQPKDHLSGLGGNGAGWIFAVLAATCIFEIQNTGSQEFIYMWPVALLLFHQAKIFEKKFRYMISAMVVVAFVTTAVSLCHRATHTIIASFNYKALRLPEIGPLGQTSARAIYVTRAEALNQHYFTSRDSYRNMARQGIAHSDILTTEPDFQIGWLMNTAAGIRALRAFQINTGRLLESVYTFDFTDPFPALMGLKSVKYVQIGLDALRTLPQANSRMMSSIANADAILVPLCPITPMREAIKTRFAQALEGRQVISLTQCWDLYVRNGSDFATLSSQQIQMP